MTSEAHDLSIIKAADHILQTAILQNASDIHFEPYEKQYRVRMRVDGVLYTQSSIDFNLAQRLNSRLKIMANLDIAERRLPQDGRFSLEVATTNSNHNNHVTSPIISQQKRDCRISTCPTMFCEKIVVRILNPINNDREINKLGLTTLQQKIFLNYIHSPQGMILVTGPTGSGKTVTLYTALDLINNSTQNISTVEDPVEITLPGINQVEINTKVGINFHTILRTFLRQDPDVIMIGEIRDFDTAQIAINAAQTGHLVLSTLHTNSAAESITRLLNMGIAAFNLAGALHLLIAQRLIRKLCPNCKQPTTIPPAIAQKYFSSTDPILAKAKDINDLFIFQANAQGCDHCKNGYWGRIGIFELLPISPLINEMILKKQSSAAIEQQAQQEGMLTLRISGLQRVLAGETSLAEINRVII